MTVSVITLTRNRTSHLVNLVRGLERGLVAPAELVVAVMGGDDPRPAMPDADLPIKWVDLDVGQGDPLPLAEARNRAAEVADGDALVFLDVDCIPGPDMVAGYADGLRELDGLLMGGVRYLPPGLPDGPDWDWLALLPDADRHPSRPDPPERGLRPTDRYELFWSLTFAVRAATFRGLGGFDPSFVGYGAEDTDFAFTARARQTPLAWAASTWSLHQHHETYDPPLDHVRDVVLNARRFHDKWGTWPMEGWLRRFDDLGVVDWSPRTGSLEFVRPATEDELAAAHRATAVPAG